MISIYFTCSGEKEARKISRALVLEKLAACVNIVPGITSVYSWKGKLRMDRECLAFVKTRATLADKVARRIKELHSYETPAILNLNVTRAEENYLDWVFKSTNSRRQKNERKNPKRPDPI